jgi:membrane-associated protein
MELIKTFIDLFIHLDKHLVAIVQNYGVWTYLILFLIIFCETGLVITPFLPGDSLLFATGAIAAMGDLNIYSLAGLLMVAAILGDTVNYAIGKYIGAGIYKAKKLWVIKREHLMKTHAFYEKYGGMTIIFARFMPIIRTFAPFVAGIGEMSYLKFVSYNVIGGITWVALFLSAGFFFGNVPAVKKNFTLVIMAIIFISILPPIVMYIKEKYFSKKSSTEKKKK